MPDRAEGARAVLRLVEILGESWMDFANRQQIRAPSGFSRLGRVELPWGLGGVTVGVTHTRTRSRCPSARRFPAHLLPFRSKFLDLRVLLPSHTKKEVTMLISYKKEVMRKGELKK